MDERKISAAVDKIEAAKRALDWLACYGDKIIPSFSTGGFATGALGYDEMKKIAKVVLAERLNDDLPALIKAQCEQDIADAQAVIRAEASL